MALFGSNKSNRDKELAKMDKRHEKALKKYSKVYDHIEDSEEILALATGSFESKILGEESVRNGILVATSKKVIRFNKKLIGYEAEEISYNKISSVKSSDGLTGAKITVYTSGNDIHLKFGMQPDSDILVKVIKEQMERISTPTEHVQTAVSQPSSDVERIKELKGLLDVGLLTQEEFEAKKKQILGI